MLTLKSDARKNVIFICIIAFFLAGFIYYISEKKYVFLDERVHTQSIISQSIGAEVVGEIVDGIEISQTFLAKRLSQLVLAFGTYARVNAGTIEFQLIDASNSDILYSQLLDVSEFVDNAEVVINFPDIIEGSDGEYRFLITSQGLYPGNSVTLWKSSSPYTDGMLSVNGHNEDTDIYFKVLHSQKYSLLSKPGLILISLLMLALFVISSIFVIKNKTDLHKGFLATILPVGIFLVVFFPPFDHLDELEHFYRAYEVSEGKFLNEKTEHGLGNYIPKSLIDTVNKVRYVHHEGLDHRLVLDALNDKLNSEERVFLRNYASSYPPLVYIPQSIGVVMSKLFFDSPMLMLYLGRLFNLLVYAWIAFYAIKLAPVKKHLIYLLALLPISIVQATSLSADVITNAASLLFLSYVLLLAYGETKKISNKQLILLGVIGVFVSLSKIVYLPIVFILFIIPKEKFGGLRGYIRKTGALMLVFILPLLVWNSISASNIAVPDSRGGQEVSTSGQVDFVLNNPFQYAKILIDTLTERGPEHLKMMIGTTVTNYYYVTPSYIIFTFLFLLFFYGFAKNENEIDYELSAPKKTLFLLVVVSVLTLIYTALYVGFTPVGLGIINGVQGRYFIPVAGLFFASLANHYVVIKSTRVGYYTNLIIHSCIFALLIKYLIDIH